jgi:phosphocarrier protein
MASISKKFTIKNKLGLHARPAALFVEIANKFESDIYVHKGDKKINGKSIMGLMMLAAGCGSKLTVDAEGPDAKEAIAEIEKIITNNFYE